MKRKIIPLLLFLLFFLTPAPVLAQEKIDSFDVQISAHKDGKLSVKENISYDFGESDRHGIFRTIPLVSKVGDLYRVIKIDFTSIKRDGKNEPYEIEKEAKTTQVKIGDPDRTITGSHIYTIDYVVENGIGSNYEDHDEIYWNATGNDWEVPIVSVRANVTTDFGVTPTKVACFTRVNPALSAQFCTFPNIFNPITTTATIEPGDGLTIVMAFPVNTFPKSELLKDEPFLDPDFLTFLKIIAPIYGVLNLLVAPYLIYWYNKHKNRQRFGSPSVNFDLPQIKEDRVTPAEAGTVDNTKLDKDDLVATIFDLAIRKYIKIEQVKKVKTLRPDETDYKLVKLKEFDDLNPFETKLMEITFGGEKNVLVKDAKLKYTDFSGLEVDNFKILVKKGLYTKNPKSQMGTLLTLGIIATGTLNMILGPVLIWLSRKLNGRTALGDEVDFKTDGLKIFLKNMKRYYKWQAENQYFVEKYIPYAMALGFIDQYMEQLKLVRPEYKPTWYSGTGSFYHSYAFFGSSYSSNITTSAPSSSSGFSGGSSGGGGGGGGGGSW